MSQEPEKYEPFQPVAPPVKRGGKKLAAAATVLGVLILLSLLTTAFLWRLKTAPIKLNFAKPYIEEALSDPEVGVFASAGDFRLYMPDFGQPILIGLTDVKLKNKDGGIILGVDEAAVSLSISRLLIGEVAPRRLILRGPLLRVIRTGENGFELGLGAFPVADEQAKGQSAIMENILKYVAHPGDEANNSPLAGLRSFRIDGAQVLIEDHVAGVSWFLPRFDAAFESQRRGLVAALQIGFPSAEGQDSYLRANLNYDWQRRNIMLDADLRNVALYALAGKIPGLADLQGQDVLVNGALKAELDENFKPRAAALTLTSLNGSLGIPGLYDKPVDYDSLVFKASYTDDGAKREFDILQAQAIAQGVTIDAQGSLSMENGAIEGPLGVSIKELPQEKIDALWPEALRGDPSEKWIVHHITGGTYRNVTGALTLSAAKNAQGKWEVGVKDAKASFDFEGMKVDYRPPMIPVTEAKGKGEFDYDAETLNVKVESGKIGDLALSDGEVGLKNIIAVGKGVADIKAKVAGPGRGLLEYAAKEPINLGEKIDFDIKQVQGAAALNVALNFPTVDDLQVSDMKIDINGDLKDVFVPGVLKTLPLTGGPLKLKVTQDSARITGANAKIDGVPVDLEWMEYLESKGKPYAGQIRAKLSADVGLRAKLGIDLSAFLEGPVPIDVVYTSYADGHAVADTKADLATARFFAEPFDYEKPVGLPGSATLKANFQNGELVSVTDLNATMDKFALQNASLAFRGAGANTQLASGKFGRLVVSETDAAVTFEISAAQTLKISFNGPFLDLRPFLDNENEEQKTYDDPPMTISVTAAQMRTAEGQIVKNAKLYLDVDKEGRFNQLEMDAVAGKGDIYLRYKPDASGKRTFRLEAADAGATLAAFDVYDKMRGGKLQIYAEPIKGVYDRNLVGSAEITDFTIVKAPSLARLLGALSLGGMSELLEGEGLSFTKLESNFNWLYRPQGSVLVLKDGRTSGNSLGLTFDGKFDNANDTLDVSGTIIPLSDINKIIGSIPLVGDILTGGTGSLFAATYTARGSGQNPEISVNPLSVLTPGILRRILFE